LACHLQIDAHPDPFPYPAYNFDADPDADLDPDFYLMRIPMRIQMRIPMRIQIRILFDADAGAIWIRIRKFYMFFSNKNIHLVTQSL
jgi:hypothetical protein